MCMYREGCILHMVSTNPEICETEQYQKRCDMYKRFNEHADRYFFAKTGLNALKEKSE